MLTVGLSKNVFAQGSDPLARGAEDMDGGVVLDGKGDVLWLGILSEGQHQSRRGLVEGRGDVYGLHGRGVGRIVDQPVVEGVAHHHTFAVPKRER